MVESGQKHGTDITWTYWPGTRGETLTTVYGCHWAKYIGADGTPKTFETCKACYAQATAQSLVTRFNSPRYTGLVKDTTRGPIWTGEVRFDETQLLAVLTAHLARTYFCTSMGDLFYGTDNTTVAKHIAVMILANWHRFLILTKRPDRMRELWHHKIFWQEVQFQADRLKSRLPKSRRRNLMGNVPKHPENVWLGTSIEGRESAAWALEELRQIDHPGRRWISYEPMLEYVNLVPWIEDLKWVVLGGASKQAKAAAPPFIVEDAELVLEVCKGYGVAAFLKQLGANPVSRRTGNAIRIDESDNHNADPAKWPTALQVQQFPVRA